MLSSNTEAASTFFNEIDVALHDSLTQGIYWRCSAFCCFAFINLFLKTVARGIYFSLAPPLLLVY